jgi:transcriptional regulator with PAS, ATPase and Fis domain
MTELNLDSNIKRLLCSAIDKYKCQDEQAKALGISKRTLYNYIKKYNIVRHGNKKEINGTIAR